MVNKTHKKYVYNILGAVLLVLFTTGINQYILNVNLSDEKKEQLKKEKISFIDKQLSEFYIPLDIQLDRSKRLYLDFKNRHKEIDENTSLDRKLQWRLYLISVFKSTHVRMEDLLILKRYLSCKNKDLNDKLNTLEKHINQYKVLFNQWGNGNSTQIVLPIHFPNALSTIIKEDIRKLKLEKQMLK